MFNDVRCKPSSDGKREINEQNGSLAKIFIPVIIIKFWDHVLKRVERGEHDHKTYTQITDSCILLASCETVLLYLRHALK